MSAINHIVLGILLVRVNIAFKLPPLPSQQTRPEFATVNEKSRSHHYQLPVMVIKCISRNETKMKTPT